MMIPLHAIHLAKDLALPIGAVTQKFAFLAQSGAGKTYAAMKLVEGMLSAGAQVVVLDPTAVWWGLRVGTDGVAPGFPVTIFGGEHGDLPLASEAGEAVARVLVERRVSAVLDVSDMTTAETIRFAMAFAETFFQAKKRAKGPVHLVLEEAQTFVPQNPEPNERTMLNRVERLLKLGRNFGVGWSLVSQQPQAVHKRSLNQAGCLVALRTIGAHERKAIRNWVSDKATQEADLDLVGELPSLETGEAFIWSPGWLRLTKRIQIAKKRTFDSSATPEVGTDARTPEVLVPVDLKAIRAAMAEAVEAAEAADPRALQRRIVELEKELRAARDRPAALPPPPAVPPAVVAALESAERAVRQALDAARADKVEVSVARPPEPAIAAATPSRTTVSRNARRVGTSARQASGSDLRRGAREMLLALARFHPQPLTRQQVATLAGLSPTSGSFSDYLSALRRAGYVEEQGGALALSLAGVRSSPHCQ